MEIEKERRPKPLSFLLVEHTGLEYAKNRETVAISRKEQNTVPACVQDSVQSRQNVYGHSPHHIPSCKASMTFSKCSL